ncbi:hypothetical protein QTP88_020709 [Uroleucon formosanum]
MENKQRKKDWFNDLCSDAVTKRNELRKRMLQNSSQENINIVKEQSRQTNRILRREKRLHEKKKIEEIERNRSNTRKFFKESGSIKAGFKPQIRILSDDFGNLITEEKEVVSHFKEYFNQLLNQPVVEEGNETIYYHTAEPMIEKPEREEIDNIINKLKNNRAPGENNIVAELLKKGGTEIRREIMEMISIGEYQSGFRKGKSTLDHIFTLRQIMAKFYEFDKELHLIFIDYKQAYDSINRDKLWEALEILGIPKKYVSLIKGCNNRTVCRVRFLQEMSETFEVKSGLRQGDALSPTLFNLALEKAMREVWDGRKMEICGERVILAYADDIVVMGETRDEVMNTASKLLKASKTIGLRVNEEKTKYLMVARRSPNTDHITVDDYSFKKVEVFKYLGVNINSNNDMHEEINDRIACGNRCYYSIMRLLKSKLLSRNSKTLLYHSYLRPIITYASETWSLTKGDSKRLMTFERKVLRNIYGPKFDAESQTYERRNNQELQELYNRPNIIAYIRSKRLEWFGHVWRADGQVIKEVLINTINKKRPLGRPRTRWVDVIAQDIKNIEEASSFDDAYDREKWRGFVMAAMALNGPIS